MAKRSARVTVAGLAVPLRVWAQRFAFLGFVALSFALMLLSKAESTGIERMRLPAPAQFKAGRYDLLRTTFETFERKIRDQLGLMLVDGGFDPAASAPRLTPDLAHVLNTFALGSVRCSGQLQRSSRDAGLISLRGALVNPL